MKQIFRYIKPYRLFAVLCVLVVFCQAMGELKLPDYMSDIVNIGVQRYGISDGAAERIGGETFEQLRLLAQPDAWAAVTAAYEEQDGQMVLRTDLSREAHDAAADVLTPAFAALAMLNSEESTLDPAQLLAMLAAMPEEQRGAALEQAFGQLDAVMEGMEGQLCALGVRAEYERIGVDAAAIQRRSIYRTGLRMLAVSLVVTLSGVCAGFLASRIAAGVARDLRSDVFTRTMSFSGAEIDRFSTASLITRTTNDIQQIQVVVTMMFRIVLFAPFMGIGSIIYALRKSVSLAWIMGLALVVLIGMIVLLFITALPRFKRLQSLIDRLNQVTRENLSGIMVSRAYNAQQFETERFDGANRELTGTNLFVNRLMGISQPGMSLLMNGQALLIVWFGGKQIAQSAMQVGDMMAYLQYAMHVVMSFMFISMIFIMIPRAAVSAKRINEVLETVPVIADPEKAVTPDGTSDGTVEFRHVSFTYPGAEAPTLRDISFTARAGETTAIIGATGSGKTTLLSLIPRIYDVGEGQVLVDGVDVRQRTQHELRGRIGYAPQKALLFTGTIAENLRLGAPEADDARLAEAAAVAQATEVIAGKEQGYDEPIAQGGTNVSGGQRQRLSIARALVPEGQILLFDDTFSALDFKTDAALRRALAEKARGKTLLLVAQRVSTIRHAQQILVLDEGRIVGRGTHDELMKSCETYREIANSQLREEELA